MFNPGIEITPTVNHLGFVYGGGCFGPEVEIRTLDSIRKSLRDPDCEGPREVYAIAMDVGKEEHKELLKDRMLLFGIVTYADGKLGDEPIRSQGHIHKVSAHCGWSTPEVYEIWRGEAIIYMQETARDNPGRCYAVKAKAGDVVIVPPYWAHSTISASIKEPLTFGAWCDRDYGFEYDDVRAHGGLAFFPVYDENMKIQWQKNQNYHGCDLIEKAPSDYSYLGLNKNKPIYSQFEENHDLFLFVSNPQLKENKWINFIP
ncbi:glucose-6-phosphate isomerase family protein [Anaerocolumna xylanovorans]|uniref:glucose-6-phosphate isomerase n=1 Tax=Anaerocolumna xylanovorans DSM 12503 TaxID=1121345 RepID=A0A1M7XZY0_9FIRM|nr:glucose-6-phosphate isomerase family protein [Anaerocolumna xylanovorans]SHO44673.1 glucose-6-phosphate isomerase [Anaerocolumna xylanovorans DSM 12503]